VSDVVDVRVRSLRRQVDTLRRAATTPTGVFEAIDEVIRNFRRANKETVSALTRGGFRLPSLSSIRRRLRW